MRLLRLELSYFRQFKNLEVFFPQQGLIGINGDNGAGKSTLFNSIDWVLNGKYKGVNQARLKTQKSPKSAKTFGVLDFMFNDDFYRVRRDLVSSPSRNFIQKNGMTVAAGTSNVNDYIKELFKMDQEAFRTCYYASQFDFDVLAKMKDSPRVEMISKLLRIEKIDLAAEQTRADKRHLESQLDAAKGNLRDEAELQAQYQETINEHTSLSEELSKIESEISELEKQRDSLLKTKQESDKIYEVFQKLSSEISNLETKKQTLTEHSLKTETNNLENLLSKQCRLAEIAHKKDDYFQLTKQKDDLNDAKEQFLAVHRIEKQISETKVSIENYTQTFIDAEAKLSQFDKLAGLIQDLEQQIQAKETTVSELRDKAQQVNTMLSVNKTKYQEIVSEKKQFEELGADVPCPTCKRPLGEHLEQELERIETSRQNVISDTAKLKSEYDKLVDKGTSEKQDLEQLKSTHKDYVNKMSFKSGFTTQRDNALSEKNKNTESLNRLQAQRKEFPEKVEFDAENYKTLVEELKSLVPIYEEIIKLQQAVQEIPKVEEKIQNIKDQIDELDKLKISKTKETDNLNFDLEKHRSLSDSIESLRRTIDQSKEIKYSVNTKIELVKTNGNHILEEIKSNQEKILSLKDFQDEIIHLTKLDQLYKTYKKDILGKLSPKLSEVMSELIDSATNGKYDRVELDDYYNIYIYRDGEKLPLEMFSGSEQQLAALCQRIAISQILVEQTGQARFDMIALDECFSAMDVKRQDSMVEMFRGLNEVFPQILIVSHNEHVKDLFDHTLHIELANDMTSNAKWLKDDNGNATWTAEVVRELIAKYIDVESGTDTETEDEITA